MAEVFRGRFDEGRGLLSRLGEEIGRPAVDWEDFVMVMNTGPLVPSRRLPGDRISNRGFNGVLLSPGGDASHYVKVRHESHEGFQKETEVHDGLAGDPVTEGLVAEGSSFCWGPARVLVSRFLTGGTLQTVLQRRRGMEPWSHVMNSVFGHTNPFWPALGRIQHREEFRALDVSPDTGKSRTMVQVRRELARLTEAGLSFSTAEYLEERLGERDVSSVPQHGDFWPRNLVRSGDGWKILDLETCGSIDLPLYDVFHLLRGSVWDAGGKGTGVWLEWWSACQHRLPALRHLVADQLRDDDSIGGEIALAAYAASFPLRLLRRGISLERVRPWIRELEELPAILEEGALKKILEASL